MVVYSRWWNGSLHGRHEVRFERGHCFFVEPGWTFAEIVPKRLSRIDEHTLMVDTGFWKYGKLRVRSTSAWEADRLERAFRRMLR